MPAGVYPRTPEICRAISEACKGRIHTEETKRKISFSLLGNKPRLGQKQSKETKHKISISCKAAGAGTYPRTEEIRQYISKTLSGRPLPELTKQKIKKRWQDLEFKAKTVKAIMKACSRKPTALEKQVLDAVEQYHLPYQYTGDGSLIIHGICPDFVNTNNQKIVIEVFGNYFHSPKVVGNDWKRSELGRVMLYNSFGFRCLILWENDIWNATLEEIAQWIKNFERRK